MAANEAIVAAPREPVAGGDTTMDQCLLNPSGPRNETACSLTVKLAPDRSGVFHGAFVTERVGSATAFEGQAVFDRTPRPGDSASRLACDSLCIYQHLRGAPWFPAGPGKEQSDFVVCAGALAANNLDQLRPRPPAGEAWVRLRVVRIPLTLCHGLLDRADDLAARPLCTGEGVGTLFRVYFHAFLSQSRHLDAAAADAAVRTLARLALLARGDAAARADDPAQAARRPARIDNLYRFIDENLCRSELTPSFAAKALGVSVRQVHLLFAPTGTTFARHVTARRLELVRMHLLHGGKRSVADIAFSSGFDNLSTFYRTFRSAFGMSPGELRERASVQSTPLPVDL